MLLPRPETADVLKKLDADGMIDFGKVSIERREAKAAVVTSKNELLPQRRGRHRIDFMEIAVDAAILDAKVDIAVLRGGAGRYVEA